MSEQDQVCSVHILSEAGSARHGVDVSRGKAAAGQWSQSCLHCSWCPAGAAQEHQPAPWPFSRRGLLDTPSHKDFFKCLAPKRENELLSLNLLIGAHGKETARAGSTPAEADVCGAFSVCLTCQSTAPHLWRASSSPTLVPATRSRNSGHSLHKNRGLDVVCTDFALSTEPQPLLLPSSLGCCHDPSGGQHLK